ncbi:hypothetical protein Tco_0515446 [Tanacetum coccineum]
MRLGLERKDSLMDLTDEAKEVSQKNGQRLVAEHAPKLLQLIFFVFLEEILLNCPLWLPVNHTKRRDALMPFSTALRVFFHIKKKIRQIEGEGDDGF